MKKYISFILIAVAVAGNSCKKTYLSELANNPNTPSITSGNLQLSAALNATATLTTGTDKFRYLLWDNYLSYSTGVQPSGAIMQYSITASSFDSFTPTFTNITNYNAVLTATTESYYTAIANIMIAYDFQELVDIYGNVPYSQALQGITSLTPAYDDASTIYDNLITRIDAAIKTIQTAPATALFPGKYDIMFGATNAAGMANWIKFANTLKLRIALRQSSNTGVWSKKSAALIASIAATTTTATPAAGGGLAAGGPANFLSATIEGAVNPVFTAVDPYESTLDVSIGSKASGGASGNRNTSQANTYFTNLLVGTGTVRTDAPNPGPNDPRLYQIYAPSTSAATATSGTNPNSLATTLLGQGAAPQFYTAAGPAPFTQVPFGTTPAAGTAVSVTPSITSKFLLNPVKSSYIIMGSESLFLQAEACEIGLLPGGTAQAALDYAAGIQASFTELGLTAAQATAYQAAYAPYPAGSFAQKNAAIHLQKYIALYGYEPLETYEEILRTGFPAVPLSIYPGAITTNGYVERIPYPTAEYNYNTAGVSAQGTITAWTPKIFWEP